MRIFLKVPSGFLTMLIPFRIVCNLLPEREYMEVVFVLFSSVTAGLEIPLVIGYFLSFKSVTLIAEDLFTVPLKEILKGT